MPLVIARRQFYRRSLFRTGHRGGRLAAGGALRAQASPTLSAELERIFARDEYKVATVAQPAWVDGGARYAAIEPSTSMPGAQRHRRVRHGDRPAHRARRRIGAEAGGRGGAARRSTATPGRRIAHGCCCSRTRRRSGGRTPAATTGCSIAPRARCASSAAMPPPSTLMFAKFSPDGRRVGYVRDRDLYVEDVAGGAITRLTKAENRSHRQRHLRLGLRRGARPARRVSLEPGRPPDRLLAVRHDRDRRLHADQRHRLAVSRADADPVSQGRHDQLRGPRRRGRRGGRTDDLGAGAGRSAQHLLPRIEWAADGRALAVQQLNRLQNRNDVLIADPRTGAVKRAHRDESKAWVDVADEFTWLDERPGVSVGEREGRLASPVPGRDRRQRRAAGHEVRRRRHRDERGRREGRAGCTSSRRRRRPPSSISIAPGSTAASAPERVTPDGAARLSHLQRVARSAAGRSTPGPGWTCRR